MDKKHSFSLHFILPFKTTTQKNHNIYAVHTIENDWYR